MTSIMLKILACVTMLIDHVGYVVYGTASWFNYIGRFAFTIFAFQISEGYIHTKNLKKYLLRLCIFALVSQAPYLLFTGTYAYISYDLDKMPLNIFFTLALGLIAIIVYDKINIKPIIDCKLFKLKIIPLILVAAIVYIGQLARVDYGYYGVLIIFFFYLFRESKILTTISFLILVLFRYIPYIISSPGNINYIMFLIFTALSIIPILLYNKRQGRKVKFALYFFYPVHLFILYLIITLI